ncbi:MAG: UDP-N-acetylmuramoyl-tripeptide--D-alanyl-D-alanine ligase [Treponema sp.]|nr:UDP-N-acetylmuramoyl-tripeptide--D-alanyl-D-alanine ligase [Treponema sp.]
MSGSLLTLEQLLHSTGGVHVLGTGSGEFFTVATDSRQVAGGTLFVPLIGEFQDGHKYIPQAAEKGASVVFISMKNYEADSEYFVGIHRDFPDLVMIAVENTMTALQKAAGCYVEQFPDLIKIAVTGSSGKTTTKEILVSIMSQKYSVVCNKGNLNSETGLPLSVFEIRKEHQCGIFEMGMNRENEIGEISEVLKASYAVVTNIGTAHIGILGSRENIAREKAKVFDHFGPSGVGVIPFDDDYTEFLESKVKGRCLKYGQDTEWVKCISSLGLLGTRFSVGTSECILSLPGKYNYRNALGAVTLARELGLSDAQIAAGINALKPMFGRSQVLSGKYTIVQDCYNANPDSMEKAVEFVSSVTGEEKKVFVLGDMLELGEDSKREHEKIGTLAASSSADEVIFVGTEMKAAYDVARSSAGEKKILFVEGKTDEAMEKIAGEINSSWPEKTIILIKGSRGMGLERITQMLEGNDHGRI